MTRQQRRAEERARAKNPTARPTEGRSFHRCSRGKIADAAMRADQAGLPGMAELFRQMMGGGFVIGLVSDRAAVVKVRDLQAPSGGTVLVVGDDDHGATGPAGWRCAATVAEWAAAAVVHASGSSAEPYAEAANTARILGRVAIVETSSQHAWAWTTLFKGKPTLLVLPREGAHPVSPPREAMN